MAEGGSLLLDEIGEMPPYLQTKLLRVLQEREYRPIGSDRIVRVDFRLICATNIDLDTALRDGKLREDLYFRINTITLRCRRCASAPRTSRCCASTSSRSSQRYQKERAGHRAGGVSPADPQPLAGQRAGARERHRARGARRQGAEISPTTCPSRSARRVEAPRPSSRFPPHRTLAEIEKMAILQTLQRTNWNKQEAAQILGLYRPTLYSKMKKHDIQDRAGARDGSPDGGPPPVGAHREPASAPSSARCASPSRSTRSRPAPSTPSATSW
jgi:transcriptional regulator with GAF, ATPase, and Fis domain